MGKDSISALKVGLTYIGVVVGAGFASGQEVLRFFNVFGINGLCGILVSTMLFWILGYQILKLGQKINASSYLDVINHFSDKYSSPIFDFILTFFLFCTFTAMLSGAGAISYQYFGLPAFLGGIFMASFSAITVLFGIKKVISSISLVVPFLILSIFIICICSNLDTPIISRLHPGEVGFSGNWFISALLYSFYNLTFSVAVLAPLGTQAKDKKTLFIGSLIGAIGLGIGSLMIFFTMNSDFLVIQNIEIPMLYFAKKISVIAAFFYLLVLIAEIYTTSVANLYGIVARFSKTTYSMTSITLIITSLGCIASLLGFSNLVTYLYPMMGYVGATLFIIVLVKIFLKIRQ